MGEEKLVTQDSVPCDNRKIQRSHEDHAPVEPTDPFSMLHLSKGSCPRHPPCSAAAATPMKRRSSWSSASCGEPSAKKLFSEQEDLSLHGFSAVHVPLNIHSLLAKGRSSPVLRRCVSDPNRPPEPPRPSGLPPLPPRFRRSVSDLSPSPLPCLSCEETAAPYSVRLRRMKDRLKEMRQLCDEVIQDNDQVDGGEECGVHEDDKVLPQDDLGEEFEEVVNVEWAEKCLSIIFRCPCGKGYEVLLSENNCYYKLA